MNELDPPPFAVKDFVFQWKNWFNNLYEWLLNNVGTNFFFEVNQGNKDGYSTVHKFGKNKAVTTSYTPLAIGGVFQTPQVAGATALRVKAGNANDTAAGSGAREITLEFLLTTGEIVTETLATAGTSASAATSGSAIRLVRAYVSASGTYASSTAGSHSGDIVIENAAGGTDWLTITSTGFPRGQSQVGVYTVPLGKTAYVFSYTLTTDSNKAVDFLFFQRDGILDAAAPYSGMRTVIEEVGIQGSFKGEFLGGQKFTELTDIGFMVQAASAAEATADFDIILVDN